MCFSTFYTTNTPGLISCEVQIIISFVPYDKLHAPAVFTAGKRHGSWADLSLEEEFLLSPFFFSPDSTNRGSEV
jgi:hypothetical protein